MRLPPALPRQPTRLLGREADLAALCDLLLDESVRLLTISGPAGVGKTRLAVAAAEQVAAAFPDGVWFVDLTPTRDAAHVPAAFAATLGVHEGGGRPVSDSLAGFLADRRALIVVDNMEQVATAAPFLAELLVRCASLTLVVTSRVRLRLRWERVVQVPPLPTPQPSQTLPAERLDPAPAVTLFVERARAVDPTFMLTPENSDTVAAVCRHLDGLPLAIELAAASVHMVDVMELPRWLERRLPVLAWEAQDLPVRQQTLRAAVAWSYDLLEPEVQRVFRRLGVFASGWTREAAEQVAYPDRDMVAEAGGQELGDPLRTLVEASLVVVERHADGESRFSMLETMREFALEQLSAAGEAGDTHRRHAHYALSLAEAAEPALRGPDQLRWFARLQREQANLEAALTWASAGGETEIALRIVGHLGYFWWANGHVQTGLRWAEEALKAQEAQQALERPLDASPDQRLPALLSAGYLAAFAGDSELASHRLDEALSLTQAQNLPGATVAALGRLIALDWLAGRPERAAQRADDLLERLPPAPDWEAGFALHILALTLEDVGDDPGARTHLESALVHHRGCGDRYRVGALLSTLAGVAERQGDHARAAELLAEALPLGRDLKNPRTVIWGAEVAILVLGDQADPRDVTRWLGAIDTLRLRIGFPRSPRRALLFEPMLSGAQAAVGSAQAATIWSEGRALSLEHLADETLGAVTGAANTAKPSVRHTQPPSLLSPREREVLALVAAGRSNRQIARELIVSPSTVNFHVTSLLNKLGADTRAQAVARAAQLGLL